MRFLSSSKLWNLGSNKDTKWYRNTPLSDLHLKELKLVLINHIDLEGIKDSDGIKNAYDFFVTIVNSSYTDIMSVFEGISIVTKKLLVRKSSRALGEELIKRFTDLQ